MENFYISNKTMFVKSKPNACSEADNEILCFGCNAFDGSPRWLVPWVYLLNFKSCTNKTLVKWNL